jgi:hypothetical protein
MDETKNPEKIGDILVLIGAMTAWQVKDILSEQARGDTRIFGEIAIELGYIDDAALARYVEFRKNRAVIAQA